MKATLVAVVIDAATAVAANHHSAVRGARAISTSHSSATNMAGSRICASPRRVTRCHAPCAASASPAPGLAGRVLSKDMAES